MRLIALLVITAISTIPQTRPTETVVYDYDAGGNLIYRGTASAIQATSTFARTCGGIAGCETLTSIVDLANTATVNMTAHGLQVGNAVTVSGGTVDADLNGTYYVQTVPDADSFTITTASVTDATYNEATLLISTTAARTTKAHWRIEKFTYSGSSLVSTQLANGSSGQNQIWANRATTTGSTKINYQ